MMFVRYRRGCRASSRTSSCRLCTSSQRGWVALNTDTICSSPPSIRSELSSYKVEVFLNWVTFNLEVSTKLIIETRMHCSQIPTLCLLAVGLHSEQVWTWFVLGVGPCTVWTGLGPGTVDRLTNRHDSNITFLSFVFALFQPLKKIQQTTTTVDIFPLIPCSVVRILPFLTYV